MPISVIPNASGTSSPAVQNTDFFATWPSLAEKIREYMSVRPHMSVQLAGVTNQLDGIKLFADGKGKISCR